MNWSRRDPPLRSPGIESKYTAEIPENGSDEFLTLNIRYKEPDEDESRLLSYPVSADSMTDVMSDNMSWAAGTAQAGMLMKGSAYAGTSSIAEIRERLKPISTDDFRDEFLYLLRKYSAE